MTLVLIILATIAIASLSPIGILTLFFREKRPGGGLLMLVALSTGAMLGNAIFHLLPEALETGEAAGVSLFQTLLVLTGAFVLSFMFEQLFAWHHCHSAAHHGNEQPTLHCHREIKPFAHLVLWSDVVHNFIDGLIIATAFIVSPALGVTTAIAVALHEVPQELGDFAVLVYSGYAKRRALFLNFLSATTVIAGGVVGYLLSSSVSGSVAFLLPFAAGSFLYVASSDLLPELKHDEKFSDTALHFCIFLFGLLLMIGFALTE
jgi:zinc and cadmium transporter